MNAFGSTACAIVLTRPISRRVTTQYRMSLLGAAHAAVALVDRHATLEFGHDPFADDVAVGGDDGDRGVLLEAVDDEVQRPRGREVGQDRVKARLDAEHRHRHDEQDDVEDENDFADLQRCDRAC